MIYHGPTFQFVETIDAEALEKSGGFHARSRPLLVRGALKRWPASERWTFESLARLRYPDGSEPVVKFQNGLVEQGMTQKRPDLPIGHYLLDLEKARASTLSDSGLFPQSKRQSISPDDTFHLDWSYMQSFTANKLYLAQWNILDEFPHLRRDFAIKTLWPGKRWTWEYVFIGPAHTVTGLHYDFPNNWFCQVRGTKEFILFPQDQKKYLGLSEKFDWGATLSATNVSCLDREPEQAASFEKARGYYARVEAGDALFIPQKTWHAVVALEPSISLGVFGLTIPEILTGGVASELKKLFHAIRLYRWGHCTCHTG